MRIVSGTHKGIRIPVRKNFPARPTTDFAKENIFNVINNQFDFEHLSVLDLFSGTGSISYEFASRGSVVISVEINYRSFQFIKTTSKELKLDNIKTIKADAFKYLEKTSDKYDIIFADPPFQLKGIEKITELVFSKDLLNANGWLILEHSDQKQFTGHQMLKEVRSYGSVNFSIFTKQEKKQ